MTIFHQSVPVSHTSLTCLLSDCEVILYSMKNLKGNFNDLRLFPVHLDFNLDPFTQMIHYNFLQNPCFKQEKPHGHKSVGSPLLYSGAQ